MNNKLKEIEGNNLGGANVIKQINSEIVSMIRYNLGIVYLPKTELRKLDVKILSSLEKMKIKQRGTTRWRYYAPYEQLGLGLRSIEVECLIELIKLYKSTEEGSQVRKVYKLYDEKKTKKKSMKGQIFELSEEYRITPQEIEYIMNNEVDITEEIMKRVNKFYVEEWEKLGRAGAYIKTFNKSYIGKEKTVEAWKQCELIKSVFGEVITMQEEATIVGGKLAKIRKDPSYIKCSRCKSEVENLEHILTGCAGRRKDYIDRHDSVGKRIYEALCKKYEIALCYQSDPVTIETKSVKIHWNQRMVK